MSWLEYPVVRLHRLSRGPRNIQGIYSLSQSRSSPLEASENKRKRGSQPEREGEIRSAVQTWPPSQQYLDTVVLRRDKWSLENSLGGAYNSVRWTLALSFGV